jgi:hypothetical protein
VELRNEVAGLHRQMLRVGWWLGVICAVLLVAAVVSGIRRRPLRMADVEAAISAKVGRDLKEAIGGIDSPTAIRQELEGVWQAIDEFRQKVDSEIRAVQRGPNLGGVQRAIDHLQRQVDKEVSGLKDAVRSIRGDGSGQDSGRLPPPADRESAVAHRPDECEGALRRELRELRAENEELRARLERVGQALIKEFAPSIERAPGLEVPDGIIRHLTREWGANVADRNVGVTASGVYADDEENDPRNAADLDHESHFVSTCRNANEDIRHERNNWICYDFRRRRILPTHYALRSCDEGPGGPHLKSWLVETSVDGENWTEIDHHENNGELNGHRIVQLFSVQHVEECRCIRLVNIGRTHCRDDALHIEAWEIFGSLIG